MYSSTYCSRHAPPATRTDQLATSVFPLAIKRDACVFGFAFVLCSCSVVCGPLVRRFYLCGLRPVFLNKLVVGNYNPAPARRAAVRPQSESRPTRVAPGRRARASPSRTASRKTPTKPRHRARHTLLYFLNIIDH